ncbi:response regulator [Winogradskyella ludwigii]|jgi:CheY-like chemotaxis protein|uniref:response regulator n=1 Tax=Winogradskyella ludwigii TaxID=2686076 RepID=UPI0015CBA8F2|nr:response regulator [Winogradskyella ludwigii]
MSKIDVACIIDDDPIFIFGAKRMMELSNFCKSFMVFKNGQEAINQLKPIMLNGKDIPDIILLDINMPIMDGWEFLDEFIKIEAHKSITIYIVSSSIDPVDLNRAKRYKNISNYIIKPISIETLKGILEEELQE